MVNIDNTTLVIMGSLLTIGLGVNAFFLKDILKTLKSLELNFTKLNTEHGIYSKLVNKLMLDVDDLKIRFNDAQTTNRERLHTLEGAYSQMLEHLKNSGE